MSLNAETLDELLLFERRAVAVVKCRGAEIINQGTRSERVILDTVVVSVGDGEPPGELQITRYTQGDPLMRRGETYLVGVFSDGQWDPSWSLAALVPVPEGQAQEAARAAGRDLRERADSAAR